MNYIILFLTISTILSCSRETKNLSLLHKIDNIILSNTDSAYNRLSTIEGYELSNREEKALYALLLTQAKDKKRISENSDSLISIAVNYYKKTTDSKMKNRSYFYLGRVLQKNNDISEAIDAYLKATNENTDDYKTQTLIYENLAACYESQNFFHKALEAYKYSYFVNKRNKDNTGMLYSLRGIANLYVLKEDVEKARKYYNQALSILSQTNDSILISAIHCDMARFFYQQGDYEIAHKYIDIAALNNSPKENLSATFFWKGKILFSLNQYDSAYYYFSQASKSKDIYTQAACYQSLYELKKQQYLFYEAIAYNDQALVLYDSIQNFQRQEELNDILKDHALTIANQEHKNTRQKYITIISFCFLITILGLIIISMHVNNRSKKKRLELQQKLTEVIANRNEIKEQIKHLILTNENTQEENKALQGNLTQLWQQTMTISAYLFQTTDSFKKIISIEKCKYTPHKQKKKEEIDSMRQEIKNTFAQAIQNLQESFPTLTHDDIIFCILSYLKLSTNTVKICMQTESASALTQRKYRIKKQLSQEIFDSIFSLTDEKKQY